MKEATYEPLVRVRRRRQVSWLRRVTRRPRHFVRRHKALTALVGLALLLLLILLLWLLFLNNKLGNVPRFEADLGDDRPAYTGGTNILLVGVDDGKGVDLDDMLAATEWRPGVFRSDALMFVHVNDSFTEATVVSLPRDSYVPVEGYGKTKINAAFSYGGPDLLGRTVEKVTGARVDHMFIADFEGFKGVTEAVDGVTVYIPADSVPAADVGLRAGWQEVRGDSALAYVRQRYGLPRGDFDRIQRQQNVLRAILEKSTTWAVLANPFSVTRLVGEITENLAVDATVTNARLRELGLSLRNLRPNDVHFAIAPNDGSATIDGASVVKLREKQVLRLFDAVVHDDFREYVADHTVDTLPPAAKVK